MDDLFTLREDGPRRWRLRGGFVLAQPEHEPTGQNEPQFLFAGGEDAERLAEKEPLRRIPGDRLEDLLGGTADDAAAAIRAGEVDDVLDAVLFAEREHDGRVTVLRAILERSDELATEDAQLQEHEAVAPDEIVTAE